jgi:hypothetical protein
MTAATNIPRRRSRALIITIIAVGVLACCYAVANEAVKGLPRELVLYSTAHGRHTVHRLHVLAATLAATLFGVACFTTAWHLGKSDGR